MLLCISAFHGGFLWSVGGSLARLSGTAERRMTCIHLSIRDALDDAIIGSVDVADSEWTCGSQEPLSNNQLIRIMVSVPRYGTEFYLSFDDHQGNSLLRTEIDRVKLSYGDYVQYRPGQIQVKDDVISRIFDDTEVCSKMTIAGHPSSIILQGNCFCGVRWTHLRSADKNCIGHKGFAHVGALNETELSEVLTAVEAEESRISGAMQDLGRTGS